MEADSRLRFDRHLEKVARNASQKMTLLHQVKHHADGLLILYKAQVRPIMEYGLLTWVSSFFYHLDLLDNVQRRAERCIRDAHQLQLR